MFKHNKFGFYAFTLCLAGLAYTFVSAALQSQVPELPTAVGSFLAVPAAALCCRRMAKDGARQGLILSAALAALAALNGAGRAAGGPEGGAYPLFILSAAVVRCAGILIYICLAALCAGWSIRCRGRMLSLILLGGPLFCAVGPTVTAGLTSLFPGGSGRILPIGAAGLLFLLALAVRFLLRDWPEEAGLYPDGDGYAPEDSPDEPPLPLRQLLSDRRIWRLILVFGPLAAVAAGSLCAISVRSAPAGGMERWLALGAGMSILTGLLFGLLADLAGSAAPVLLACAGLLPPAALLLTPAEGAFGPAGAVLLGAGMACLAGGIPVLVSCALGRLYGRRQFAAAGAVVFPAILLCAAGAPIVTAALIRSGLGRTACVALLALAAIGLAASPLLRAVREPNAAQSMKD